MALILEADAEGCSFLFC